MGSWGSRKRDHRVGWRSRRILYTVELGKFGAGPQPTHTIERISAVGCIVDLRSITSCDGDLCVLDLGVGVHLSEIHKLGFRTTER